MGQDFRFALRALVRHTAFTSGAILTLALGIGATTAIFTLADAALSQPMPGIADPSELVWLSSVRIDTGREAGLTLDDYREFRQSTGGVLSGLLALEPTAFAVGGGAEAPERIAGHLVTGSYFATLGVQPAQGRLLTEADDRPDAPPAVVISHRLWRQRMGGTPEALSDPLTINGRSFGIAGVAPEGFSGPVLGRPADVWVPLAHDPRTASASPASPSLLAIGRLRSGASVGEAQAVATAVARRLSTGAPAPHGEWGVIVTSAAAGVEPQIRGELVPLAALTLVVSALVLLIACANVSNLLLARGAGRAVELAIRAALGASRARLVRQLLAESLVLAAAGALAGLLISFWTSDLLLSLLPESEFRGLSAHATARVLAFTTLLAVGSVCAFGVVPALLASRGALQPRLREAWSGRSRLQGAFVVAQLALSLALLSAAGLSVRVVQKAGAIDLGFNPTGLSTASYDLPMQNYSPERRIAFRRRLLEQVQAWPGVERAALANLPPLNGMMVGSVVERPGPDGNVAESRAFLNAVGPGYFSTLGIPVLRGREFGPDDGPATPMVVILNETLADRLGATNDVLGQDIVLHDVRFRVVGIVGDSKYDEPTEPAYPFAYTALDQRPHLDRESLIVRSSRPESEAAVAVRAVFRTLDPALPLFDEYAMEGLLQRRLDKPRGLGVLLGAFGAVALLLASLGLYAVTAYAVARRTRELGVRVALGATPRQLRAMISADSLRLAVPGLLIGSVLTVPLAAALGAVGLGLDATDVTAFLAMCGVLMAAVLLASVLPARRAARVDPLIALRAE